MIKIRKNLDGSYSLDIMDGDQVVVKNYIEIGREDVQDMMFYGHCPQRHMRENALNDIKNGEVIIPSLVIESFFD